MDRLIGIALFLVPCVPLLLYPRYWLAIWIAAGLFGLGMSDALFDPDVDIAALLRKSAVAGVYNLALLLTVVFARRLAWKLVKNSPKAPSSRGRWNWQKWASD
jgi:UDP-N-acetylmuramyl pentapeptide phosphotransferase/UDP-N-acetylglucosamine-1-phosphate transferase